MWDDELSCKELVEIVTNYLEDRLDPRDKIRFESHLGDCPACAAYLQQMRETVLALARIPDPEIPEPMRPRLLAAFRSRSLTSSLEEESRRGWLCHDLPLNILQIWNFWRRLRLFAGEGRGNGTEQQRRGVHIGRRAW